MASSPNVDDDLFVVSADGCFLLEKLPLMLSPKSHRSPNFYKKNDSLIFSVTSEKNRSDKDEMLIDSKEEEVSRELTKLQIKLSCLQSKMQSIKVEDGSLQVSSYNCSLEQFNQGSKQNQPYRINAETAISRAGIIKKMAKKYGKERNKNEQRLSLNTTNNKRHQMHCNMQGRISHGNVQPEGYYISNRYTDMITPTNSNTRGALQRKSFQSSHRVRNDKVGNALDKSQEVTKLRRLLNEAKLSITKSQRKKSAFSQHLSQTKCELKKQKDRQKKYQKQIQILRAELKKSQIVRNKQKQVILRQKKQLQQFNQYLLSLPNQSSAKPSYRF